MWTNKGGAFAPPFYLLSHEKLGGLPGVVVEIQDAATENVFVV